MQTTNVTDTELKYVFAQIWTSQPKATSHRVTFPCLHCPELLIFLIFPDSWFSLSKSEMRERDHGSVCDRGGDMGEEVTYFTVIMFAMSLTRWQCSVGRMFDKFYQLCHHFGNFFSPPYLSLCVCVCVFVSQKCNNCSKLRWYVYIIFLLTIWDVYFNSLSSSSHRDLWPCRVCSLTRGGPAGVAQWLQKSPGNECFIRLRKEKNNNSVAGRKKRDV